MARRVKVDEDALEAAYRAGDGLAKLQQDFGINRMTARKILKERGVTIRRPGRPRKPQLQGTQTGRMSSTPPASGSSPFTLIDNTKREA